jgi:hypothetical protein
MDQRYETWEHVQAPPGFVVLTSFPTIARLECSGTDLTEAERRAQEAKARPEVLAASVRVVEEE